MVLYIAIEANVRDEQTSCHPVLGLVTTVMNKLPATLF
jgi:hypothetical protein